MPWMCWRNRCLHQGRLFSSSFVYDCLLALCTKTSKRICMRFSWNVGNGLNRPMNKWLNFGGDLDHRLDTKIVFRIRHYWEIWKVVSMDCAVMLQCRACTSRHHHSNYDVITSLAHDRCALADVCTVRMLLVWNEILCSVLAWDSWRILRVKWSHIYVVAIRSPFCRSTPSYCA